MLLTLCLLLGCTFPDSVGIYSGRERQLNVRIPRFDADVVIDGDLGDSAWARAARLTGFSQYAPNDGVPAADSTQVLVWYSPNAIYFGIRAYESHGRPTMTLANRDQIFGDDNVQILLGTFHDAKQVLMFAVNPLGVQGDGSLIEGANVTASGFIGGAVVGREQPDLSLDFVFQSRGRVTDWGYEVEVRIPFKSIRYQPRQPQDWKLNIVREVQHSGFEDSWFPARRASATFIGQSGNLVGLSGMHRGLVMDLNPEATGKARGAPARGGSPPRLPGGLGVQIHDQTTMHAAQAHQVARLSDERRAGATRREPGVLEPRVLHLAYDVQLPVLRLARLIPDALERNPHLDFVSPIGDAPARLKDEVGAQVGLLPSHDRAADEAAGGHVGALDQGAIALDADGIHGKHQGLLPVVKRAEQDLHVVVVEDLVAIRQSHRGTAVQLEGANAKIDGRGGVPHQHMGGVRGRHAVVGG